MTRNDHKTQFKTILNRMEARFVPAVYMALRKQYLRAISHIKNGGVVHARAMLHHEVMNKEMGAAVLKIYKTSGVFMANRTLSALNKEPGVVQKKYATFGFNDEWVNDIIGFFRMYLLEKAVVKVSETTREKILAVLEEATTEGWSNDQIISQLSNLDEIRARARMIVRTETVRAANYGVLLGADKYEYEVVKEWMAIEDSRTRHSHRTVDQQTREVDERFSNGLRFPGDPEAPPEQTINCRCRIVMVAKRDQNGRLIPKRVTQPMRPIFERLAA